MSNKKIVPFSSDIKVEENVFSTEYTVVAYIGDEPDMHDNRMAEMMVTENCEEAYEEANECIPLKGTTPMRDPEVNARLAGLEIIEKTYCDGELQSSRVIFIWEPDDKE